MRASLHFDRVAPGGVTLPFLLAAPVFAVVAGVLLLFAGADVLASRWHRALIGALHAYTIGFLLLVMAGALLQIGPVLTARPALQSERVAAALRALLGSGALLLACGLFYSQRGLVAAAAFLLGTGAVWWWLLALRGGGLAHRGRALLPALAGLGIGIGLGVRLASGHAFPALGLPRQLTDLHAGWMLLGGIAPLVMAVGNVVIPMFQHTPPLPRMTRYLPMVSLSGMALATMSDAALAGWLLAGASLAVFALCVLRASTQRRGGADATVSLFRLAMLAALAGLAALLAARFVPEWHARLQWLGGLLLIAGFGGCCVQGMLLKIVPFLVRMRLQHTLWDAMLPARALPGFRDLLPEKTAAPLPKLAAASLALLATAALTRHAAAYYAGGVLFVAAHAWLAWILWRATADGCRIGAVLLDTASSSNGVSTT